MKITKILLIVFLTFLSLNLLHAKTVPEEKAYKVAENWIKLNTDKDITIIDVETIKYQNKPVAYLFHLSPKGFVMVPINDKFPPIKAYSFKENFDGQSMFVLFIEKELFQLLYDNSFANVDFDNNQSIWSTLLSGNSFADNITEVGPLLSTTWNQTPFYNEKFPTVCSDDEDNITVSHFYAGCVIIAMGQVMNYYKWPLSGRGAHIYEESTVGIRSANFSDRNYNWDIMPSSIPSDLDNSSDNKSIDEISLLLYDISVAVEAQFSEDATSAYLFTGADALYKYFKYKPTQYILRKDYGKDSEWFEVFKNEIDNGRPAILGISTCYNNSIGHAVVVDGYKISGDLNLLHINMGYGGVYDGWYAVNKISSYIYQFNQDAIIGITPDNDTDYFMFYDTLKIGDSFANTIKVDNNPNIDNKEVEAVKFSPYKCGLLNHISFFVPYSHVNYEVNLYEGDDNITSALTTEPVFTSSGTTNLTGWNYVEIPSDIQISVGKNYYVVVSLSNIMEDFDYIIPDDYKYLIVTDNDGEGTGNSFYGYSTDTLEQHSDVDVLIRMALKDSYSCDNSSTGSSGSQSGGSNTTITGDTNFTLYKYDGDILYNPDNVTVEVDAEKNILIQPVANVSSDIKGENVNLKLFLYLPDYNVWIPYPDVNTTLGSSVTFSNISEPLDLTGLEGFNFQVWFGFTVNNDVYYNNFNVETK